MTKEQALDKARAIVAELRGRVTPAALEKRIAVALLVSYAQGIQYSATATLGGQGGSSGSYK